MKSLREEAKFPVTTIREIFHGNFTIMETNLAFTSNGGQMCAGKS